MTDPTRERIELLSVELLDQQRPIVEEIRRLARSLKLEFGWHYLLDLSWIISHLGLVSGKRIMDAGAGTGILQWYLADHGAEMLSVDRTSRVFLPPRFRSRYHVSGLRPQDLAKTSQVLKKNWNSNLPFTGKIVREAVDMAGWFSIRRSPGRVIIYNQDLENLADIPDGALDAVVAVSALEHNQPEGLQQVVNEIMRALRPGGVLLATLGAHRDQDWWHAPSSGWCYSEASLRRLFSLGPAVQSNYDCYDELFASLCANSELRQGLASFYFHSGENGMPWGRWDPQYLPVGVLKTKPDSTNAQ